MNGPCVPGDLVTRGLDAYDVEAMRLAGLGLVISYEPYQRDSREGVVTVLWSGEHVRERIERHVSPRWLDRVT